MITPSKSRSSSALTEADSDMQLRGPSFAQWQREETPQGQILLCFGKKADFETGRNADPR